MKDLSPAWMFSKNGRRFQETGFTEYDVLTGLYMHDKRPFGLRGGCSFCVLQEAEQYTPVVQVCGQGAFEGEPAQSLRTAKKRALVLAMAKGVLFHLEPSAVRPKVTE